MSKTELELITLVGAHDATLDDLDKRIAVAEARVPTARALLDAAREAVASAEKALAASRDEEKRLLREVRQYENRSAAATRALESGLGDPDAAERQLSQVGAILDELETNQLEQMEATETATEALAAARAAEAEAEAELASEEQAVPPILAALRSDRAAAQVLRDGVWEELPKEVQSRYGLVRKKRKTAVSLLVDGYCSKCRRKVPLQEASDVRTKGLVRHCANCGRYLVLGD